MVTRDLFSEMTLAPLLLSLPCIDGVIDRKPKFESETQAVATRLATSAPGLRNRAAQTLKDNKARFQAIREGHPGSKMLPDTTLSD